MRRRTNVAARGGPHERVEQAREALRQFAFPKLQWRTQTRALVEVEYDRPARPDCVELRDDRFESGHGVDLLEQCMPLVPGDFDDLARYVDPHSIKISPVHSGRAYTGFLRVSELVVDPRAEQMDAFFICTVLRRERRFPRRFLIVAAREGIRRPSAGAISIAPFVRVVDDDLPVCAVRRYHVADLLPRTRL